MQGHATRTTVGRRSIHLHAQNAPGHITHTFNGLLQVGNYNCHNHEALGQMMADFAASGIKAKEMPYDEMRWKKLCGTCPLMA